MNEWRSSGRREKVVFPKRLIVWRKRLSRGRDGLSAPTVMNSVLLWGKVGGVLDSRCPPSCPRKGCDVSCVNLTLIRRVINARVNIRYLCIYRCKYTQSIYNINTHTHTHTHIYIIYYYKNAMRTGLGYMRLFRNLFNFITTVVTVYTTYYKMIRTDAEPK
jgi:hypothetical protein